MPVGTLGGVTGGALFEIGFGGPTTVFTGETPPLSAAVYMAMLTDDSTGLSLPLVSDPTFRSTYADIDSVTQPNAVPLPAALPCPRPASVRSRCRRGAASARPPYRL